MENKRTPRSIVKILEGMHDNYKALLSVDIKGNVLNVIFFSKNPSFEEEYQILKDVSRKFKGCCGVYIFNGKTLSLQSVKKQIREAVEALEYAKMHKLKPGVNIPEKYQGKREDPSEELE